MYSIQGARSAHVHATYHIPFKARHEFGSEAIIRELEAEAVAARRERMSKLRKAAMALYRRMIGRRSEIAPEQAVITNVALGIHY